jgi:hypothetical protein
MSVTRSQYAGVLKSHLNIRVTNHGFWLAWMLAESGTEPCNGSSGAKWNPLNTTWREPGSTNFNSVGVQNFPSYAEGIAAEASTLRLSYYAELIHACRNGAPLGHLANLLQHSPYGTGTAIWAGIKAYEANPQRARSLTVGE